MNFENIFEIPAFKNKEEERDYLQRTYNTFCVNYVNRLRENIELIENKKGNKIIYSFAIPIIKEKIKKLKHKRTSIKPQISPFDGPEPIIKEERERKRRRRRMEMIDE